MSATSARKLPALKLLGEDLLRVSWEAQFVSLAAPFACTLLFFFFAAYGWHLAALISAMALSFVTYASTSHDLVHKNLGLPLWLNETLLAVIELLAFRSGHAYRVVHLYHHAHFPDHKDIEGRSAQMSLPRALIEGVTLQFRIWRFALGQHGPNRRWVIAEVAGALVILAACLAVIAVTVLPAVYACLAIAGSWIYPFMTAYLVHDASGRSALTQTRRFRGRLFSVLALEHLYHLEHHLYPQVPHQNWPELARRLDPYLNRLNVPVISSIL
jgi:beta-carotene hydroxylase